MKKSTEIALNRKRKYSQPAIERVTLDHEISMVMDSLPPDPEGPVGGGSGGETGMRESYDSNPFKTYKT